MNFDASEILILGKGLVGDRLQEEWGCSLSSQNITCFEDVRSLIKRYNPKIIVNCIDYTDTSEAREYDKSTTDNTLFNNTTLPILLAEFALRNNIKLIHVGSGCVYRFDYNLHHPLSEDYSPDYLELLYNRSKIYSQVSLEVLSRQYDILIANIRLPLDIKPHNKNILTKLLKFDEVIDIPNSATYIPDFIDGIKHLIEINATGLYNMVSKGYLRYPELLNIYKKYVPDYSFKIADAKQMDIKRTNILLSVQRLEKSGFQIRSINDILDECVTKYLDYSNMNVECV